MTRKCSASSCTKAASGYSTYCDLHKQTLRRHGHADQKGVTVFELQPFRARIEARRAKNPANPTWALLEARWEALTAHAAATLEAYASGAPAITYERQTAEQLMTLRSEVAASTIIDTALAMFAMWEQRPSRFRSDKAFSHQLSRRVRGLAVVNAGSHWSAKEGRMRRTYRDVPPRVLVCMAESLKAAFGVAGVRLAELEVKEAEGKHAERRHLHDALREMK